MLDCGIETENFSYVLIEVMQLFGAASGLRENFTKIKLPHSIVVWPIDWIFNWSGERKALEWLENGDENHLTVRMEET